MSNVLMLYYSMQALLEPTLYGDGAEVRGHGRVIGLTEGRAGDKDDGLVGDRVVTSHRHRGAIYLVHIHLRGRPQNFFLSHYLYLLFIKRKLLHTIMYCFFFVCVSFMFSYCKYVLVNLIIQHPINKIKLRCLYS